MGCSTGFFVDRRGDWPSLIDEATALSLRAIELAALSEDELPGLLAFLGDEPSLPCDYVSVHAPSKERLMPEEELVTLLAGLPPWVETVVAHPDTFEVPERWSRLGRRLAVENMDRRKHGGRTAQELATVFALLPDASLCFDIAHAWAIDGSMREGEAILDRFGGRLRQLHVSSLDDAAPCPAHTRTRGALRFAAGPLPGRTVDPRSRPAKHLKAPNGALQQLAVAAGTELPHLTRARQHTRFALVGPEHLAHRGRVHPDDLLVALDRT